MKNLITRNIITRICDADLRNTNLATRIAAEELTLEDVLDIARE